MDFDGWQIIADLGEGGQGKVFKVRSPQVADRRAKSVETLLALMRNENPMAFVPEHARRDSNTIRAWTKDNLPQLLKTLSADDPAADLGALKDFHIPDSDPERSKAIRRLEQEIAALDELKHPAILKLLHANADRHFIVTEYHPLGSLETCLTRFRGDVAGTLAALLPVAEAVAQLHGRGIVHRDIKLANIFIAEDGRLVLGDFGIVLYSDATGTRLTETYERVGSRDWMPPWAHTGRRLEDVPPSFDVFALGKVLWCMISGERMLPYWYHRRAEHDLERKFPRDSEMPIVNAILDACVVEHENHCHPSAENLFGTLSEALRIVRRGGLFLREGVDHPCRVCARGVCRAVPTKTGALDRKLAVPPTDFLPSHAQHVFEQALTVRIFRCDFCHNLELFHFPPERLPPGWIPSKA